jgi:hypothetical protein
MPMSKYTIVYRDEEGVGLVAGVWNYPCQDMVESN